MQRAREASLSEDREQRLLAAVLVGNHQLFDKETYLDLASILAKDEDYDVRQNLAQSIFFNEPRADLIWAEMHDSISALYDATGLLQTNYVRMLHSNIGRLFKKKSSGDDDAPMSPAE